MGLTFLVTCPDDLTKCLKGKPFLIVAEMYFFVIFGLFAPGLSSTSIYWVYTKSSNNALKYLMKLQLMENKIVVL